MLSNLINNPIINNFCEKIKKFNLNKKAKLCGVDYGDNDYLNFKLYIELIDVPSKEILLNFLDEYNASRFLYYSKFWNKERESSLALGIKLDSNDKVDLYYHIKFDHIFPDENYLNNFIFLKFLNININSLLKGISVEICKEKKEYIKYYVYVNNPVDIEKILISKGYKGFSIKEIKELELYSSKDKFKINIINKIDNFTTKQDIWSTVPSKYIDLIKESSLILDSQPIYNGFTTTNIVSVYYSLTNKPFNILNI